MADQDKATKGRKKLGWLYAVLTVLVILLGAAPLLVLFTYTRDDLPWHSWLRKATESEQEQVAEPPAEGPEYILQYVFRYCDHVQIFEAERLPENLPAPPQDLTKLALIMANNNLDINGMAGELINIPAGWHVAELAGESRLPFMFVHVGDLCPECRGHFYLGIFQDHLAVFEGVPPQGMLVEITEHPVKETDRDILARGVPFHTEEEKDMLLQTYTS